MTLQFAKKTSNAIPIVVLETSALEKWLSEQSSDTQNWVSANGFKAGLGEMLIVPDSKGQKDLVLFGWGSAQKRVRGRFHFAVAAGLPEGTYFIQSGIRQAEMEEAAFAWLLAGYKFDRYKSAQAKTARLVLPEGLDGDKLIAIAKGDKLARDLINTPANDLGPDALQAAFEKLAKAHGAKTSVITGDDLLKHNFPMIHAVGRASDQQPRLLDLSWGNENDPTVTLVGKGVCFDTGGLNIKPGASMGLMKKDMGGAATVLGLAQIIMQLNLKLRLRVLIPAVENSISAGAMRPGDILISRTGLSVEVNNTDAEGRLVLADALAYADEQAPDYLFCMATLTGAARVALGPDLAPFYTDDDALSHAIGRAARKVGDPCWRMPFWEPYEQMIEPDIADLDNAPAGGFAGSITAALFLRRFVRQSTSFAHFDVYGWNPKPAPGRPKGGAFLGARAILETLMQKLGS